MKPRPKIQAVSLVALLLALLTASAAFGAVGSQVRDIAAPSTIPCGTTAREGPSDEGAADEGMCAPQEPTAEPSEELSEEPSEEPSSGSDEAGETSPTHVLGPPVTDCAESGGAASATDVALRGIDNAIAHVSANCARNGAPGLLIALRHLETNRERHAAHDAARAAANAARDETHTERKPSRPDNGHGNDRVHGQSGDRHGRDAVVHVHPNGS